MTSIKRRASVGRCFTLIAATSSSQSSSPIIRVRGIPFGVCEILLEVLDGIVHLRQVLLYRVHAHPKNDKIRLIVFNQIRSTPETTWGDRTRARVNGNQPGSPVEMHELVGEVDQFRVVPLHELAEEVEERGLVLSVLGVVQLGQVTDVEAHRLRVLGPRVHDVADQQDQLQQLRELFALPHLLARRRRRDNVRLAILN